MPPTHIFRGYSSACGASLTQIKIGDEGDSLPITLNGRGLPLLDVQPGAPLDA